MHKLRLVLLCHFSNSLVRERLPLSDNKLLNFSKGIFKRNRKVYEDFSPWVSNLISEFGSFEDVELHIIAPHKGLRMEKFEFEQNTINYHFYRPELPFPFNKLEQKFCRNYYEYSRNRSHIKHFINQIEPDIVNLIGAENPYYSIGVLDISDNIPVYLSCQTVYSNPNRQKLQGGNISHLRWNVERRIFSKVKYYGCTGRMYYDLIKAYKRDAIIFPLFFPVTNLPILKNVQKKYDFVWFAQSISVKKGIDDAIEALAIVKRIKVAVSLLVVGACDDKFMLRLQKTIDNLKLNANITFHDYFPKHEEMLQFVMQARYALLPIKLDVIPGTIIEAMSMGIPVITSKTSGTPRLNSEGEAVLISDIGDTQALADNMLNLMSSSDLADKLKHNASQYLMKHADNTKIARTFVEQYRIIIAHHNQGTEIPEDLLFNTDEYPIF